MRKKTKGNNKGFSLVEIIIAIAIMAILAGALAPQLIRYIAQSRKSSDVEMAQSIATAVNTALAQETAYDDAVDTFLSECVDGGNAFQSAIKAVLGGGSTNPTPKTRGYNDFYIDLADDKNSYSIYAVAETSGTPAISADNMLYPVIGINFVNN